MTNETWFEYIYSLICKVENKETAINKQQVLVMLDVWERAIRLGANEPSVTIFDDTDLVISWNPPEFTALVQIFPDSKVDWFCSNKKKDGKELLGTEEEPEDKVSDEFFDFIRRKFKPSMEDTLKEKFGTLEPIKPRQVPQHIIDAIFRPFEED